MAKPRVQQAEPVAEGLNNVTEPLSTMPQVDTPEVPLEGAPSLLDASIEAQVTELGRQTAKALRKFPQVEILIPPDPLNKHDKVVEVCINGWNFRILRNVWVKIPSPVVDLLAQGGYNPSTRNYTPKIEKPFEMPPLKIMPNA